MKNKFLTTTLVAIILFGSQIVISTPKAEAGVNAWVKLYRICFVNPNPPAWCPKRK